VLVLNPSYKPAEQAIAEINKLEQEQNELFTPQGRTLDKEKRRKVLREIIKTLRLVRDTSRSAGNRSAGFAVTTICGASSRWIEQRFCALKSACAARNRSRPWPF